MITVNSYPDAVVPAGNPVLLDITGDDMFSQTGSKANFILIIQEGETIVPGDSLTIAWAEESITITFEVSPNSSLQYYSGIIDSVWKSGFFEFLENIYLINRDFSIFGIQFTHREPGDIGLNVSADITNILAIIPSVTAGANSVMRDGYQLICQILTLEAMIGEEAITPNSEGNAVFDVSEYVLSALENQRETTFTYPWGSTVFVGHPTQKLAFKLKYAEKYDGEVQQLGNGDFIRALMAGGNAHNSTTLTNKFLTNSPAIKKISANCPERLYFYNETARTVNLQSKKYFTSGSTITETVGSAGLLSGQVYEINADILGSAVPDAGTVVKYDLWLATPDGTSISETKTYLLDYRYYRNTDYFYFLNSLGGYDLLRCTGRRENTQVIERQEFEDEDRNRRQYYNVLEETYTANTGSISREMEAWLNDFMLSRDVYWIRDGEAVPVIITSKKKTPTQDDQRRFNLSFDYAIARKEEYA